MTLRLAARLARASGRVTPKDWWEVYAAHTPEEWLHQVALSIVDPWGDDRADLRAALNSMAVRQPTEGENSTEIFEALRDFMKLEQVEEPDEIDFDADAIEEIRDEHGSR